MLGSIEDVGRICGRDPKAPYHWRHANTTRDAGDIPSARTMRSLLSYTAANDIPLKPEHLIWGAPAAEIEDLLDLMQQRPAPVAAAE